MSTKLRKQQIKCTTGKLLAASQAGPLKCTMLFNCQTLPSCKKKIFFKNQKKKKKKKKKTFPPLQDLAGSEIEPNREEEKILKL
jgi:hypothetical protein